MNIYVVTYIESNNELNVAWVDLATPSEDDAIEHADNEARRTGLTHFVFKVDGGGSVAGSRCVHEARR